MSSSSSHSSSTSSFTAVPSYFEHFASMAASLASYMKVPFMTTSGIAAVLTSLLYLKQKALIYPSHLPADARTNVPKPSQYGITDWDEFMIHTPDGESLSAFYLRAANKSHSKNTTIIMFHGNAGNIGHRIPIARMFTNSMDCNVLMLEYRGYGLSTGSPDEKGLLIDAQSALDYLTQRPETQNDRIVVYGQSLGGAVSIKLVAKNQHKGTITGLVLENTFLSMRKLIPSVMPPAKYLALLCHQLWPSDEIIPSITQVPILFLSGLRDEIVPPNHMRKLYEICQASKKIWRPLPGGDHNSSVMEAGYFDAIHEFITDLPLKEREKT